MPALPANHYPTRRTFLQSSAIAACALSIGGHWMPVFAASPILTVDTRIIEVNGKPARVFSVVGPDGRAGLFAREGDRLDGLLRNASSEALQMHWHGQVKAAADQDRSRPDGGSLAAGELDTHAFELTPGTHWMHSHSLTEQLLLAAPMVTREKDAGDVQDVVIMLHDFAFRSPQEILAELGGTDAHVGRDDGSERRRPGAMPHGHGMHGMPGRGHGGHMMGMTHANDVRYDAYLANDRTLSDPEVVRVDKGGRVRLRIINGGTATAFFISTPGLRSVCITVDGSPCRPLEAQRYPLAQGQRIDLLVDIPQAGGSFPVLAQVEAAQFLTGIVLATAGAAVRKLSSAADRAEAMLDLAFEAGLRAAKPLAAKRPDKSYMIMLGEEPGYLWTINGRIHGEHKPLIVGAGQRVELTFMNPTSMMHPMHLHGHHFQVVGVRGQRWSGPIRDTVIVPAHTPVTVAFDANLRGSWFLHCHHLYHMATGMMTEVRVV
jgi:FtsP/CotA-like multicopper oxidase with cupredoxin domain